MTGLLLTIDDESPLLIYEPPNAWKQGNSSTDPIDASRSYGKTFKKVQQSGATMSFTFEGVGVIVYGSKDVDHGNFTINLDGQNHAGQGAGPLEYQSALFTANYSLLPGTHTITILTQDDSAFTIDYVRRATLVSSAQL
ncbi:hypothetical protein DXG01_012147 [Tephrocybe rancida]|nr:hypothetical protein DXG01_012147 [Tephrocybe rancida]